MMDSILLALEKIFFIAALIGAGMGARKFGIFSESTRKDMSMVIIDILWPALIFSSIINNLSAGEIVSNWYLPLLAMLTGVTGYFLAMGTAKAAGYKGGKKQMFLYHGTMNNYVYMAIPFVEVLIPGKGIGLLFIHNLGYIIILWTLGVAIFQGKRGGFFKNLLNPGLGATFLAIFLVLTGWRAFIPAPLMAVISSLGSPTVVVALLVIGSLIYELGFKSLKFDLWNILLGIVRLMGVPALLLGLALLAKNFLIFEGVPLISNEALMIFMVVNLMPVSINSVSMAIRYGSSPELAAEGVVFTHLFSIITIALFLPVLKSFF